MDPVQVHRILTVSGCVCAMQMLCHGQTITSVQITPNYVTECDQFTITIGGNVPGGASPYGSTVVQTGTTITVELVVGQGGGPASFSQPIPPVGPYPAGWYSIVTNMIMNGNLVDTHTINKTIYFGVDPFAGLFGSDTICTDASGFDLLGVLNGSPDPDGVWTGPQNQNHSGTFLPGTDPSGLYTYTINTLAPCTTAVQQVSIVYFPQVNDAGVADTLALCDDGPPIMLFQILGGTPDTGGQWSYNGLPHDQFFVPGSDQEGVYTYSLSGTLPCAMVNSTATVFVEPPLSAGTGNIVTICDDETTFFLFDGITGVPDTTGTWYDPGNVALGGWDTEINPAFIGAGMHPYTYVVSGPYCVPDTALLGVHVVICDGVEEPTAAFTHFDLMPNPSRGLVTLELNPPNDGEDLQLEVLNTDGRIAYTTNLRSEGQGALRQQLDLSALPAGLYVVRVINGTGSASRRLVLR
ncbi:MAG: T9SS type A sorting domain-containing protein [Flavobacteriales bacterium]|nr:T9SS type A sorting domain-containing protein [Flavobacteriales bacterium]